MELVLIFISYIVSIICGYCICLAVHKTMAIGTIFSFYNEHDNRSLLLELDSEDAVNQISNRNYVVFRVKKQISSQNNHLV